MSPTNASRLWAGSSASLAFLAIEVGAELLARGAGECERLLAARRAKVAHGRVHDGNAAASSASRAQRPPTGASSAPASAARGAAFAGAGRRAQSRHTTRPPRPSAARCRQARPGLAGACAARAAHAPSASSWALRARRWASPAAPAARRAWRPYRRGSGAGRGRCGIDAPLKLTQRHRAATHAARRAASRRQQQQLRWSVATGNQALRRRSPRTWSPHELSDCCTACATIPPRALDGVGQVHALAHRGVLNRLLGVCLPLITGDDAIDNLIMSERTQPSRTLRARSSGACAWAACTSTTCATASTTSPTTASPTDTTSTSPSSTSASGAASGGWRGGVMVGAAAVQGPQGHPRQDRAAAAAAHDSWEDLRAWMRSNRAEADEAVVKREGQRSADVCMEVCDCMCT